MLRAALFFLMIGFTGLPALAGPPLASGPAPLSSPSLESCNGPAEAACMLDAIWAAASRLPEGKRARLAPDFAAAVAALDDPKVSGAWAPRLGNAQARAAPVDYARQTA